MIQKIHSLIVIMKKKSKLHLMKASCVRLFNKEDVILIKIINDGSIRVTTFGIGN